MTVQPTPRFARRCGQLDAPIDVHEHFVVQQFANAGSSWDKENDDSAVIERAGPGARGSTRHRSRYRPIEEQQDPGRHQPAPTSPSVAWAVPP